MSDSGEPTQRGWTPMALPDAPPPAGAYSRVIRAGDFIFVSGQVPRDLATGELMGEDVTAQTRAVLQNLGRVLEAAGASLDDVVSITAYLADDADWPAFDAAYRGTLKPPYPTRTTVGAGLRDVRVEISAVAYVPAQAAVDRSS